MAPRSLSLRSSVSSFCIVLLSSLIPSHTNAYDALDPTGNITIVWDVMKWTSDGYVAQVTLYNYQMFRKVNSPGWGLNWTWTSGEIIWNMQGAGTTSQGNCSQLAVPGGTLPYCCETTPSVRDKSSVAAGESTNCCKGGVLSSMVQDPGNSISQFQLQVGNASNNINSVKNPTNFTMLIDGYKCTDVIPTAATFFEDAATLTRTQAISTFKVACSYSAMEAKPLPTCCVSLSAFYDETIVPCASCACACGSYTTNDNICSVSGTKLAPYLTSDGSDSEEKKSTTARLCSPDGCPISVHYHLKTNYEEYWRAKITIINRDLYNNWTDWNLAWEHPNFVNFTEAFSFNLTQVQPYGVNNSAVMWGTQGYNKDLAYAGENGNVQSEFLFGKVPEFTLSGGWAFPRKIYFNGEECVMPNKMPSLPSSAFKLDHFVALLVSSIFSVIFILYCN